MTAVTHRPRTRFLMVRDLAAAEMVPERRERALEYTVGAENDSQGQALAAMADRAGPEMDDSALLRFAQSGDQRALDELCRRGWRPVYRSFARFTRDPAEAEDPPRGEGP